MLIPRADVDADVVEEIRAADEFRGEPAFGADTLDFTTLVSITDKGKRDLGVGINELGEEDLILDS